MNDITQDLEMGTCKWFSVDRGYGFLTVDNGEDLFVHHSDILGGRLEADDRVSFEIGSTDKGPKAINVEIDEEH